MNFTQNLFIKNHGFNFVLTGSYQSIKGLQQGYAVLTKSGRPESIRQNLELFDFEISQVDMKRLNELNQNQPIAWAANGLNPMESAPPLTK